MFDRIIGQERPKDILKRAIENKRVPHAYLFSGPEGVGKEAMAIELAKALYCEGSEKPCNNCSNCHRIGQFEHPDIHFIFPAPKSATVKDERQILDSLAEDPYARKKPWAAPNISIDKIRQVRRMSAMKPMEGLRIVIISDADTMNVQAANALLKILEEPPPNMHLVLVTSRTNALLATIISRCQEVRFSALSDTQIAGALRQRQGLDEQQAEILSRISQGSYGRALQWMDEAFEQLREDTLQYLRTSLQRPIQQFDLVRDLLDKHEKKQVRDLLGLLLLWFRDSLVYINSEGQDNTHIVNLDKLDVLEKFVGTFEYMDVHKIIDHIEESIRLVDRNVQMDLILLVLFNHITDNVRFKR